MNIKNLTKDRFFDLIKQNRLTGIQIAERLSYDVDDYPNKNTHPASRYIISKGDWDKASKKFKLDLDTTMNTNLELERRAYRGMLRNLAKDKDQVACSEGVKQGLKYLRPEDIKYFNLLDDQCKKLYSDYLMEPSSYMQKRKRSVQSSNSSLKSEMSLKTFNAKLMKMLNIKDNKENADKVSKITQQFGKLGINAAASGKTEKGLNLLEKIKNQVVSSFKQKAKKIQESLDFPGVEKNKKKYAPSIFSVERLLNPVKRVKTKHSVRHKNPKYDTRVSFPSYPSSASSKSVKSKAGSVASKKSSRSSNSVASSGFSRDSPKSASSYLF